MNFSNEEVVKKIVKMQERTGSYYGDQPEYKHVIIQDDILVEIEQLGVDMYEFLENIKENYDIDFFSVKKHTGPEGIKFRHITSLDKVESIKSKGIVLPPKDCIGNLGYGIYAVLEDCFLDDGNDNLAEWISCGYYSEIECGISVDLAEVIFEYKGEYVQCIYGDDTSGFVLIEKEISPESIQVNIVDLYEFI